MTNKRRIVMAGIPAGVACLVLGILAMLPPSDRPGVTKANFDRIEKGMTGAEVDAIFGKSSSAGRSAFIAGGGVISFESWRNDDGAYASLVLDDDVVAQKSWNESTETITAKIRRWLHWPWW
jgi:hypothetical protein